MTTFEMRFIALRCKDTIAPTGTIAQGVGAKQVNAKGEVYEDKYGLTTSERVYGTVMENLEGRGPCYLRTEGISDEQDESLKKLTSIWHQARHSNGLNPARSRASRMWKSREPNLISWVDIPPADIGWTRTARRRSTDCMRQEMSPEAARRNT